MACFSPLSAFLSKNIGKNGKRHLTFSYADALEPNNDLFSRKLSCGQCIGCRLEYSRQWAIRCMHESSLHQENSFITLTYNNQFCPKDKSLNYSHFTNFMKRLRKRLFWKHYQDMRDRNPNVPKKVIKDLAKETFVSPRYYMGAEYGELSKRPHYHVLIFGFYPSDCIFHKSVNNIPLFTSSFLSSIWSDPVTKLSMGFVSVGSVTFESAAYVARYMMKKVKGDDINNRYYNIDPKTGEILNLLEPESARMSRRPGIAKEWFNQFKDYTYEQDSVIIRSKRVRPPSYYDRLLKQIDPSKYDAIKEARVDNAGKYFSNNTPDRLEVRRICTEAKLKQLPRNLE